MAVVDAFGGPQPAVRGAKCTSRTALEADSVQDSGKCNCV